MMVRWANDCVLKANATKILVNVGEMLVNDCEMSAGSYTNFITIDEHFPSLTSIAPSSRAF